MNKTATFIPRSRLNSWTGDARLFKLSEPLYGHQYVVVSRAGHDTDIFGADENGEVQDWAELPGSSKGGMNHAETLANAGYIIVADPKLLT